MLALLLLNANHVVPVVRLADELYGDAPPATALTQIQAHVSQLRKLLDPDSRAGAPGSLVETRSPGYLIRLAPEQLDLRWFERWTAEAAEASARGDLVSASRRLRDAVELWRGPALADLGRNAFAQPPIARLEDLRLAAIEERVDVDLALGRDGELVAELEALVSEHPLRERLHGQLMVAFYRSGRQVEALDVYRRVRKRLVDEIGIEPTPALQELERAVLRQDRSLDPGKDGRLRGDSLRSVLVVPSTDGRLDALLAIGDPLARRGGRELIVARLLADGGDLGQATSALNARRAALDVPVRGAAFTTSEPVGDVIRLALSYDVELVLLDAGLDEDDLPDDVGSLLERLPVDLAILARGEPDLAAGTCISVPFGGGEHDWAALELGARLASATGVPLLLVGTAAEPQRGRRDASRLLADASLAVQRLVDVESEPVLVEPRHAALAAAVGDSSLVVTGISPRWRQEGIGEARRALLREARPPVVLVHNGLRPGGLAPRAERTRFTWSIES